MAVLGLTYSQSNPQTISESNCKVVQRPLGDATNRKLCPHLLLQPRFPVRGQLKFSVYLDLIAGMRKLPLAGETNGK
jgi:hypothetical protein